MNVRWDFLFEAHGFRFGRKYAFACTIAAADAPKFGLPAQNILLRIEFELDKEPKFSGADESGMMRVFIPGDAGETKRLAYFIAQRVSQQISFNHGELRIHFGLVTGERLPETAEEKHLVSKEPYFVEMRLVEAEETGLFNAASISSLGIREPGATAMRQFNAAAQSPSVIDQFLGFCKALEMLYCGDSQNASFRGRLQASTDLFDIAKRFGPEEFRRTPDESQKHFHALIDEIVRVRNHCAHLRRPSGFGYAPGDIEVSREVEPLVPAIRKLASESIRKIGGMA